jgi:hypothetical protein
MRKEDGFRNEHYDDYKTDYYRNNAIELVKLAQRAASSADKGRLLAMAEAWLSLEAHNKKRAHVWAM